MKQSGPIRATARFITVGMFLLVLLCIGIWSKRQNIPEATEIILTSLAGVGIWVNALLGR